ncbi:thiamine pyrophosphate-binding protein [Halalkalicoccus tibetensis]|uniref:Thiamine pyrophosphate-binding protein n=1 Tax=Halalkalicoccus tibetensis TaxID=175632 RepID=A0ABD5V911_9EURY
MQQKADRESMTERDNAGEKRRGSDYLYEALVDSGIKILVGLPGTQTLPLDRTVAERDEMQYVMARHETAIPHIAWGYYESGGDIAATITIPGPGETNAMHGLKNAFNDCVPIVHISADSDPDDRGKSPIHELEPETFDHVVKSNYRIERSVDFLGKIRDGIETAQTPPFGPIRLGIPSSLLDSEFTTMDGIASSSGTSTTYENEYQMAVERLNDAERPVVYIGGGARRSTGSKSAIKNLVNHLNSPVVSTYKGKGVFPEDDPRFMGVTGSHLPAGAKDVLRSADTVLALGTDFDGVTTSNWALPLGDTLIHVNIDMSDTNVAYSTDITLVDDVAKAAEKLSDAVRDKQQSQLGWDGANIATDVRNEYFKELDKKGLFASDGLINTPQVLQTLREILPRETIVTTDVGGFRLWAAQVFESYDQNTYITAGSWGGMGVGLPAAIGAQLANPERPVVALTGDGSLMMCIQELHTAVEYDLDLTTIVFNNSDYGVISKSPEIDQYTEGHQFQWSSPDFATIAEGFGCCSDSVETISEVRDLVTAALTHRSGPELIDIQVDPSEPTAAAAAEYTSSFDPQEYE